MNGFVSNNQGIGLKALVLYVLVFSNGLWRKTIFELPFAPFIGVIDFVPSWIYVYMLLPTFLVSALLVLLGKYVSISLTTFGLILFFLIMSSINVFSNSLTFTCLVIILSGLSLKSSYIINIQVSFLYIGAFINKALDVDWWNGRFFDTLATLRHPMPLFEFSSQYFNGLIVAQVFSISSMFIELTLGVLFLMRKKIAFALGLMFHLGMLILTNGKLSVLFMFIMSATYLIMIRDKYITNSLRQPLSQFLIYFWFVSLTVWNFRNKILEFYILMNDM
ncbi:MAG: hypothetical protein ABJH98_09265 [Reichenbachiella sp.]|uniref:hypothetical protein n=1 Tax=Reichenbachiella sp. TaxID=2184521 RepID=UPI003297CE8A